MRSRTIAAAATIGVAMVAGTAQAQAAAVAVDQPCYLEGQAINVTGNGFSAGGSVNLAFDGSAAGAATADTAGNIAQPLAAPFISGNSLQHTFSLAAQDATNPALAATAPVTVTKQAASISPHRARPSRKVTFNIHGMPPGRVLYLHYVFHRHQRYVKRMGTAKAPCGALKIKRRFFPVRRPRVGTWTFQFDNRKKYSKHTLPRIAGPVTIFNTFR